MPSVLDKSTKKAVKVSNVSQQTESPIPQKKVVNYNDSTRVVSFTSDDGILIEMSPPRTRQLVNVRKILKAYEPEVIDNMDEEIMGRVFSVVCVSKYGDAPNMSYDTYLDLSMGDGLLMAKCLEFYKQEFEALQQIV